MQPDWTAAQSYQHSQSIVTAINDFILGLKLNQRGISGPQREQAIGAAKDRLCSFLSAIENLAEQADGSTDKPLVGATPSLCALAQTLAEARRGKSVRFVRLRTERIGEIRSLLEAKDPASQERLFAYLSDLRAFLEDSAEEEVRRIITEP
jgi:hypothetical protein